MTIIEINQVIMKRKRNSENQQLFGRVSVADILFLRCAIVLIPVL